MSITQYKVTQPTLKQQKKINRYFQKPMSRRNQRTKIWGQRRNDRWRRFWIEECLV